MFNLPIVFSISISILTFTIKIIQSFYVKDLQLVGRVRPKVVVHIIACNKTYKLYQTVVIYTFIDSLITTQRDASCKKII